MERREFSLACGRVCVEREGTQVRVTAVRPDDGRGLYHAVLRGARGSFPFGTLAPGEGMLRLTRRVAVSTLEQAGCWPVTGGEIVLSFPFDGSRWTAEAHPERLFSDGVLRRSVTGGRFLLRQREGGFTLAARFDPCAPFPIPPLFCFGRLGRVKGERAVLFEFDADGLPLFEYKPRGDGDTKDAGQGRQAPEPEQTAPR